MELDCPCLTSLAAFGIEGTVFANIDFARHEYGLAYGQGCDTHDLWLPPFCNSDVCANKGRGAIWMQGSGVVSMQGFCAMEWCYVNATLCNRASVPSTYALEGLVDPRYELHYSYAACGTCDLFTGTKGGLMPLTTFLGGLGLLLAVLTTCLLRRHVRLKALLGSIIDAQLRYAGSNNVAAVLRPLSESSRFHIFLSHAWQSGQDQMRHVKLQLQLMLPTCSIFLDVDDLDEGRGMEYVDLSEHVVSSPSGARTHGCTEPCPAAHADVTCLHSAQGAKSVLSLPFHARFASSRTGTLR